MKDDQARQRIERLFQEAVSLPPDQRDRFLGDHCQSDSERGEIEKLLKYDAAAGSGLTEDVGKRLSPTQDLFKSTRAAPHALCQKARLNTDNSLPGTVLANRYRVVGMLGKGGMGEVYRADDLGTRAIGSLEVLAQPTRR